MSCDIGRIISLAGSQNLFISNTSVLQTYSSSFFKKNGRHHACGSRNNGLTFQRVIRKRSTEEFSCIPYITALLNCLLYTWYGLPIVSRGWENFPVITINGLGILLETSFIFIYRWFAVPEQKKFVSLMVMPVIVLFTTTALVSSFVLQNHHHRKVFVGSIGLVASIFMYGSPLVAMAPNLLGSPIGLLQLVLYGMYRKSNKAPTEANKKDLEKDGAKFTTQQQEVNEKKIDN
ncbi:bidirectional sugar transporter SWEET3b isoform X3 [Phoenix dactylifera]|uniref:Bidirectional sugar transporter SWEET n=1 Tax=Phoenix dactylifera TaxID=42345 RepID=A0A8B8J2K2_PHODC|nr:bidirectional sugar transporter SWEET3b isoform X3 [Phoenix dactylifera]